MPLFNVTTRIAVDADTLESATQCVQDALNERIDTDSDILEDDSARVVGFHIKRAANDATKGN
jgi:hypothetical protein